MDKLDKDYSSTIDRTMSEKQICAIRTVDEEIHLCKSKINFKTGNLIKQLSQTNDMQRRVQNAFKSHQNMDLSEYVQLLTKLKDCFEEKAYLLGVERQKDKQLFIAERNRLQAHVKQLQQQLEQKTKKQTEFQSQISNICNKKQKIEQALVETMHNLSVLRKEDERMSKQINDLKFSNETLIADNRILVRHLDKLELQNPMSKHQNQQQRDKEIESIKSLYRDKTHCVADSKQVIETPRTLNLNINLLTRAKIQEMTTQNAELKDLIRQQNNQLLTLKAEKKQHLANIALKSHNLEKQKQLTYLWQQTNNKLNSLIVAANQKILALEKVNHTLKQALTNKNDHEDALDEQTEMTVLKYTKKNW